MGWADPGGSRSAGCGRRDATSDRRPALSFRCPDEAAYRDGDRSRLADGFDHALCGSDARESSLSRPAPARSWPPGALSKTKAAETATANSALSPTAIPNSSGALDLIRQGAGKKNRRNVFWESLVVTRGGTPLEVLHVHETAGVIPGASQRQ